MLDEGPSKLYDALSLVLGLEDLVNAQTALADCRLARQKPLDISDAAREQFVEQLKTLIAEEPDDRASACLSVEFLLELAASGANQAEILASYPQLNAEALAAAFSYAARVLKHDRTIDLPQPA